MPIDGLPDFESGRTLTAEMLNAIVRFLRRHRLRAAPGSGLRVREGPGGTTIELVRRPGFWAKITAHGSGSAYTYQRLPDAPGGGWGATVIQTGTCYNADGLATLGTPFFAWLEYVPEVDELRFRQGTC